MQNPVYDHAQKPTTTAAAEPLPQRIPGVALAAVQQRYPAPDWFIARGVAAMSFVPPPAFLRALELKGTLEQREPEFQPAYNDEYDFVGILGLGNELGLWKFIVTQPGKPKIYIVEINGRVRELREPEVPGWALGVLDATGLEIGPFAYREGLA